MVWIGRLQIQRSGALNRIFNILPGRGRMYLSYFGIRVTDLKRSVKFYTELFGLKEVGGGDVSEFGGGVAVLLKDPRSGQRLELNWYPGGSTYATTYTPGEGLDHISFRVNNVAETVKKLEAKGVEKVELLPALREVRLEKNEYTFHVAYIKDPDGNWIELYDHSEPIGGPVPDPVIPKDTKYLRVNVRRGKC